MVGKLRKAAHWAGHPGTLRKRLHWRWPAGADRDIRAGNEELAELLADDACAPAIASFASWALLPGANKLGRRRAAGSLGSCARWKRSEGRAYSRARHSSVSMVHRLMVR